MPNAIRIEEDYYSYEESALERTGYDLVCALDSNLEFRPKETVLDTSLERLGFIREADDMRRVIIYKRILPSIVEHGKKRPHNKFAVYLGEGLEEAFENGEHYAPRKIVEFLSEGPYYERLSIERKNNENDWFSVSNLRDDNGNDQFILRLNTPRIRYFMRAAIKHAYETREDPKSCIRKQLGEEARKLKKRLEVGEECSEVSCDLKISPEHTDQDSLGIIIGTVLDDMNYI